MSKLYEKIEEEFFALVPPTIFFLFTLGLIAVLRVLMLKGTGIPVSTPIQVAVGALILGKAVLIADMLPGCLAGWQISASKFKSRPERNINYRISFN